MRPSSKATPSVSVLLRRLGTLRGLCRWVRRGHGVPNQNRCLCSYRFRKTTFLHRTVIVLVLARRYFLRDVTPEQSIIEFLD